MGLRHQHSPELRKILQCLASAAYNGAERIVRHVYGQFGFERKAFVKAAQQCTTTGEIDAAFIDIGRQFRRRGFQCLEHGFFQLGYRFIEREGYFRVRYFDGLGNPGHEVAATDLVIIRSVVKLRKG